MSRRRENLAAKAPRQRWTEARRIVGVILERATNALFQTGTDETLGWPDGILLIHCWEKRMTGDKPKTTVNLCSHCGETFGYWIDNKFYPVRWHKHKVDGEKITYAYPVFTHDR
jgi:hypothetical protein